MAAGRWAQERLSPETGTTHLFGTVSDELAGHSEMGEASPADGLRQLRCCVGPSE